MNEGQLLVSCNDCSTLFLWSWVLPANCMHEIEENSLAYAL